MISDDPAKSPGRAPSQELFHHQLERIIGDPISDLELVAPYIVPGETGTDLFVSMARRSVKVNS